MPLPWGTYIVGYLIMVSSFSFTLRTDFKINAGRAVLGRRDNYTLCAWAATPDAILVPALHQLPDGTPHVDLLLRPVPRRTFFLSVRVPVCVLIVFLI